jgi:hypothetical protein
LETVGDGWKRLGTVGDGWGRLETVGDGWRRLGTGVGGGMVGGRRRDGDGRESEFLLYLMKVIFLIKDKRKCIFILEH